MATLALLVWSEVAQAATFKPCGQEEQFKCTTVDVPLDRTGAMPGTIGIHVRVARASTKRRGVAVVLSGGPGQGTSSIARGLSERVAALVPTHDFAFVDQRGTGLSGVLRCRGLEDLTNELDPAIVSAGLADCAAQIGERRSRYTTVQSVHDLEAVRRALGARKLSLIGFSYGTIVAQTYARLYPTHVSSLILDSVVTVAGVEPLSRASHAALPRAFRDLCARKHCAGFTADAYADYVELARRLADAPLAGTITARDGRRVASTIGGHSDPLVLFDLVVSTDFSPAVRATLPSAIGSALVGDPEPLLRISHALRPSKAPLNARAVSLPTFVATVCGETPLPWDSAASFAERTALAEAFAAPYAAEFAPYTAAEIVRPILSVCGSWPEANVELLPSAPLPNVPTLIFSGAWDVRTPLETARALDRELPQSTLIELQRSGHSSAMAAGGAGEVACFLLGWERATCAAALFFELFSSFGFSLAPAAIQPVAPVSLAALRPAPGVAGDRGRVLAAVRRTLADALYATNLAPGTAAPRVGGLRGGTMQVRVTPKRLEVILRDYAYVPNVRVSGVLRFGFGGLSSRKLTIRASDGLSGSVALRAGRMFEGRLGGKPVSWSAPSVL